MFYFFISMVIVRCKVNETTGLRTSWTSVHNELINNSFKAPMQYRLLHFYLAELLRYVLPVNISDIYILLRLLWTFLSFISLHYFLKHWFDFSNVLIGSFFFAIAQFWSIDPFVQEAEPLNILFFILGIMSIRDNKFKRLLLIVTIGSFNKMTMIFLPALYFIVFIQKENLKRVVIRSIALFSPVVIICGGIRLYYNHYYSTEYMTSFFQYKQNWLSLVAAYHSFPYHFFEFFGLGIFYMYNVLWILIFIGFGKFPSFIKRSLLLIPLFFGSHFIIARIMENRLFLPLAPIIICAGLFGWKELKKRN